jgi:hypothetical protein
MFVQWEKEAQEAAKLKQEKGLSDTDDDLKTLIKKKQQHRAAEMDNFFDMLAKKYGGKTAGKTGGKKTSKKK